MGPLALLRADRFVSSDSADWIEEVVRARIPAAVHCADPFDVVQWAQTALDEVRRVSWNTARGALHKRRGGRAYGGTANQLVKARHALWKNPARLSTHQQAQIAWIAKTDPDLHRAYLLKEGLRHVFELDGDPAKTGPGPVAVVGGDARLPSFRKVIARVVKHRAQIEATLEHRLTNGLIESTNTKIRLTDPTRLRLPQSPGPHRPGDALPRRHLPASTRPNRHDLTHGLSQESHILPDRISPVTALRFANSTHRAGPVSLRGGRPADRQLWSPSGRSAP